MGPDLLQEGEPDWEQVLARARRLVPPEAPIIDALLHQGVAAGIGNVYKSELLFMHRLHPLTRMETVEDELLLQLFQSARSLLLRNLGGGPRITREARDGAGDLWVYSRAGRPCLRCGAQIRQATLGRTRRITRWCPTCQDPERQA